MAKTDDELTAYVASAARLLGVELERADPAAIAANLRNYRNLYEAIRGFDPGDDIDPAAVYRP
jgi:hypothetical protein